MRFLSRLKAIYLSHFAKPAGDRALYRAIYRGRMQRIVEIGLGSPTRAARMIRLARAVGPSDKVRYVAVDLFEARGSADPQFALKQVHRTLKATGAAVQLIPGDPATALARHANALPGMDLVVISAEHDACSLASAWFYLPRMLHDRSCVLVESRTPDGNVVYNAMPRSDIERLASAGRTRRAA